MLEIKEKVEIESSVKLNQILTTMYSSVPDVVERTHLVIACAREGALCLLHFVGRGYMVAEFKYKGQESELLCTEARAAE